MTGNFLPRLRGRVGWGLLKIVGLVGLAIVARRASDAGGKLEFESPLKNGRGTRFLVWLPLGDPT